MWTFELNWEENWKSREYFAQNSSCVKSSEVFSDAFQFPRNASPILYQNDMHVFWIMSFWFIFFIIFCVSQILLLWKNSSHCNNLFLSNKYIFRVVSIFQFPYFLSIVFKHIFIVTNLHWEQNKIFVKYISNVTHFSLQKQIWKLFTFSRWYIKSLSIFKSAICSWY